MDFQSILMQAALALVTVLMSATTYYVKTLFTKEKQQTKSISKQYALRMLDNITEKAVGWANQTIVSKMKEISPKLNDSQINEIQKFVFTNIERLLPDDAKKELDNLPTLMALSVEDAIDRRKKFVSQPDAFCVGIK